MRGKFNLCYKNIIGNNTQTHSLFSPEQLKQIADVVEPLILDTNKDRNDGLTDYRDLPYDQFNLEQSISAAEFIRSQCSNFIVVDVNNSAVAAIALKNALVDTKEDKSIKISIISPQQLEQFLSEDNSVLDKTAIQIIHRAQDKDVVERLKNLLISVLGEQAFNNRVFINSHTDYFDILTNSGMLLPAVCGVNLDELLAGARAMDVKSGTEEFLRNPAAMLAAVWYFYSVEMSLKPLIHCPDCLGDFANWAKLLFEKSSEIEIKHLLNNSIENEIDGVIASIINVSNELEDQIELKPSISINLDSLTAYNLGQLVYLFEVAATVFAKLTDSDNSQSKTKIVKGDDDFNQNLLNNECIIN